MTEHQEWISTALPHYRLRFATVLDVELILEFIQGLADFEKMSKDVVATCSILSSSLFGADARGAQVLLGYLNEEPVSFALFFHNFSTFLGRPGLYLEDLFVKEHARSHGIGTAILRHLAQIACDRNCPRFEWVCLDWNVRALDFYKSLGAEILPEWKIHRTTGTALKTLQQDAPKN